MPLPILILLLVAAVILVPTATGSLWLTVLVIGTILIAHPIVRVMRKNR